MWSGPPSAALSPSQGGVQGLLPPGERRLLLIPGAAGAPAERLGLERRGSLSPSPSPEAGGPARALVPRSATVREGYLLKRKEEPGGLAPRFAFKKRYFRLSADALSYAKSPEWQVGPQPCPGEGFQRGPPQGAASLYPGGN